jgi:uncharacterized protein
MIRPAALCKYSLVAIFSALLFGLTPQIIWGQVPTEKSLMWEISGPGIKQPSYLFGTIHSACTNQLVLKPQQKKVLDKIQQLYLEVDITDGSIPLVASAGMLLPRGQRLDDVTTPQEYRKVKNFFAKEMKGVPFWSISNLRPMLLSGIVAGVADKCPTSSWEVTLGRIARKKDIAIKGLETAQDQLSVFDRIPIKDQVKQLMDAIDNRQKVRRQSIIDNQNLHNAYKNQDIAKLYGLVSKGADIGVSSETNRQFLEALLDERNRKWIPIISRVAQEKPTLFGVGAGHLGGKQGVISLLRTAGYQVRPVFEK